MADDIIATKRPNSITVALGLFVTSRVFASGTGVSVYDGGLIPSGRYTEAIANDFRLTHFQGIQRLNIGKFLVVSGGDNVYKESHLFIVRMGSRKSVGAWRSNYLTGRLKLKDTVAGIVKIASGRWHAGGISIAGDLLAVPVYSTGKTVDKITSAIQFALTGVCCSLSDCPSPVTHTAMHSKETQEHLYRVSLLSERAGDDDPSGHQMLCYTL